MYIISLNFAIVLPELMCLNQSLQSLSLLFFRAFFAFSLSLSLCLFGHTDKKIAKKKLTLRHKKNIIIMFASSQSLVQHHQRFSSPALIASTSRARNNTSLKKRANAVAVVVGAFF